MGGAHGGSGLAGWREGEDAALASCYRRSLEVAGGAGARSIAFPAISTGAFGFPEPRAARVAVATVGGVDPSGWERILLVGFDRASYERYRALLPGAGAAAG